MKVCFYAQVPDRTTLDHVEFYKQDIDILRALGFEVVIATNWREIPRDVDFYFVWWWQWGFMPMWKNVFARRPCIITGVFFYRSPVGTDYLRRPFWQKWLMQYALKSAHANVFTSQFECEEVTGALEVTNPLYVPLGVDADTYRVGKQTREDFVLMMVGMHLGSAIRKCVPQVIRSIPHIRAKHPDVRFVIAGKKGSDFRDLASLAEKLGVEEIVEFPGAISREKKIELMQRCKVYVSPSRHEGFGLAILEAMSCGAPVVSSPVGAVPEVVGDAGLLVDGTSPDAIASAINRYLENDSLRAEMSRRARCRAETVFPLSRRKRELEQAISGILRRD